MTAGLEFLTEMEYPGRFIIVGRSGDGDNLVVSYGLTGRSAPSKARRFVQGGSGVIRTDVTDPEQLKKGSPALLLYPAVAHHGGMVVASNGAQTRLLYGALRNIPLRGNWPSDFAQSAMGTPHFEYDSQSDSWIDITSFEPDAPNFTPRISLVALPNNACLHIVRKEGGERRAQVAYAGPLENGAGRFISTYSGENRNPLPAFAGDPKLVNVIGGSAEETNDAIFEALNPHVRVAVATMYVNDKTKEVLSSLRSIHY